MLSLTIIVLKLDAEVWSTKLNICIHFILGVHSLKLVFVYLDIHPLYYLKINQEKRKTEHAEKRVIDVSFRHRDLKVLITFIAFENRVYPINNKIKN